MTDVQRPKRRYDRLPADQYCLNERGAELLLLLTLDRVPRRKNPPPPSKEILEGLTKIAIDQFAVFHGRMGKVPD